jgi:ankyrin repeat protein
MATLPAHPSLDQLRHQAKDLLRAAKSGDAAAAAQLAAISDPPTLSAAQLVVARSYGFSSWPALKAEVHARAASLDQLAAEFCVASVRDWTGKAVRMLAQTPELAGHSLATALLLGDAARVRAEIDRDPAAATRADPATGWTPLHAVCASRWHSLDPDRASGLLATARLLLDAGADLNARIGGSGRTPFNCAAAAPPGGADHEALLRLLLERGAVPGDHDLYLTAFSGDDLRRLRLLLDHTPDVAATAVMALAAPVSTKDTEGVRLLLEAGADPDRYADDEGQPTSAVYAAVRADCPAELIALLIAHGADPARPGPDGLTPGGLATIRGRTDLAGLLGGNGLPDTTRFVGACMTGDRAAALDLLGITDLTGDPAAAPDLAAAAAGLTGRLDQAELTALVYAAEAGNEPAVSLMLDLGFPLDVRRDDGATALHAAAYAGDAPVVRLLLDRGADPEAPDGQWESPALEWAVIGSGFRPNTSPHPDWIATVRVLIEAGASTQSLSLSPDDTKPPSPEVAELLRSYGVGGGG